METNLLDRMLNTYLTEQTTVAVTLQNRIRVAGKIKAFDSYVIVMDSPKREILYRHAISSLTPMVQEEQKRQPESHAAGNCQTSPRQRQAAEKRRAKTPDRASAAHAFRVRAGADQQQHERRPAEMDAGAESGKIA